MKLSNVLAEYVKSTYAKIRSNLFITDLEKILIAEVDDDELEFEYYLNKPLSADLQNIITEWGDKKYSEEMFICKNDNLMELILKDPTDYSAQMVFPIYHNNKLDGLAVFFRTRGDYIKTSSKAPKTMRNFIEIFSDNNYKLGG